MGRPGYCDLRAWEFEEIGRRDDPVRRRELGDIATSSPLDSGEPRRKLELMAGNLTIDMGRRFRRLSFRVGGPA